MLVKDYIAVEFTPEKRAALSELLDQAAGDSNLALAIADLTGALLSRPSTCTEDEAVTLIEAMTEAEAKADLVRSIRDYKKLSRAGAALLLSASMQPSNARKATAKKAALGRLANDDKQAAKGQAEKLWQERRAGKHTKLRTDEQFATEVMRRWPVLTSSAVICGWCTKWKKEAKKPVS
jgi:hypothetical protein